MTFLNSQYKYQFLISQFPFTLISEFPIQGSCLLHSNLYVIFKPESLSVNKCPVIFVMVRSGSYIKMSHHTEYYRNIKVLGRAKVALYRDLLFIKILPLFVFSIIKYKKGNANREEAMI